MITTKFGFTGDDLPEDHILYDFDGQFYVQANVSPGCEARINCDPDDGWPAEPAEIEIIRVRLGLAGSTFDRRILVATLEAAFMALIDSDEKLRGRVREEIWESYAESRLCRMGD